MNISIHVTGLTETEDKLTKLGASLLDFTMAFSTLGASLLKFYSDTVFVSGGTALGQRWVPLKQSTMNQKSRKYPGRGMLVRSGAMQHGFYSNITPVSLYISNNVPWFKWQQQGTSYRGFGGHVGRGRNLAARPMIGTGGPVNSMIKAAFEADMRAKLASVA